MNLEPSKTSEVCCRSYQDKLDEYDALDFDDLLVKTVELLERVEEVRETYRKETLLCSCRRIPRCE